MNTAGFSINALTTMNASVDATETKVLTALAELTTYFQEGHDFPAFLRQIHQYALLRLGMVLPDLHDCSSSILDSSDSLLSMPSAWLPPHLRNFSSAPFSSCIKSVTDITAVAHVFCGGDMPMATRLLASDPAHWPYAPVYDLLSLSLTPNVSSHGSARPFGPPTAEAPSVSPERLRRRLDAAEVSATPTVRTEAPFPGTAPQPSPAVQPASDATDFLASVFGKRSSYAEPLNKLHNLLDVEYSASEAPPDSAAVAAMVDRQPGYDLHRIARLVDLPVPPLTKDNFAGWGLSTRSKVVASLVDRLRRIFWAFHAATASGSASTVPPPPSPQPPPGAAFAGGGGGGGGTLHPPLGVILTPAHNIKPAHRGIAGSSTNSSTRPLNS